MKAKANYISMLIAGTFLIVASWLKIHQMLSEPIMSEGFWESWLFFLFQVPLEMGLGLWMICGFFRKAGWVLGTIAYFGFIIVTAAKAFGGLESCGCFGTVTVNPWITLFTVDIPLFLLLVIFRPKGLKLFPPPWPNTEHFLSVAIPTAVFIIAIVPILALNKPIRDEIKIDTTDTTENSDVNIWQKMLDKIDVADQLREGTAIITLYHNDCPTCQESVPLYDEFNQILSVGGQNDIKFAFIELPPHGQGGEDIVPQDTTCITGKMAPPENGKKWYVASPMVIITIDGNVTNKWEATVPMDLDELLENMVAQNPVTE